MNIFKVAKANWRTTMAACIVALTAIGDAVQALIDSDPATTPNWNLVIALVVAALGLLFARDSVVTSDELRTKGIVR